LNPLCLPIPSYWHYSKLFTYSVGLYALNPIVLKQFRSWHYTEIIERVNRGRLSNIDILEALFFRYKKTRQKPGFFIVVY
jgi:hypothetical protein